MNWKEDLGEVSHLKSADRVVIVSGPTAVGKSSLALKLAQELNGEIISADSAQVYRDFNIGTDKPSQSEQKLIKHHCIDIFSPIEQCTVATWLAFAHAAIKSISKLGKLPIIVGGTNLYIEGLLNGLNRLPARSPELRLELEKLSSQQLHDKLMMLNLEKAEKLNINDRVRVIRAIEVCSHLKNDYISELFSRLENYVIIKMERDRNDVYARINNRVQMMLAHGLLNEVEVLYKTYGNCPAFKVLGYKQCLEHITGLTNYEQLGEAISQATRRYAKRQMTFWRNAPLKSGWNKNEYYIHDFHQLVFRLRESLELAACKRFINYSILA